MNRSTYRFTTDRRTGHKGDDWRAGAACRDEDPETFFSVGMGASAEYQDEQAKAVCRRCSVRDECLEFAIDQRIADGVWGGMTPAERSAYHRKQSETRR